MTPIVKPIDDSPLATMRHVLERAGCDPNQAAEYATLIAQEFDGQRLYMTSRPWGTVAERNDEIRARAAAGLSIRDIAKHFCLAKSVVHRIIHEGRA